MMPCYFQGCSNAGETKEHIPPKAFFPIGQNINLLKVPSCKEHNNDKSQDDIYVLAHICLNASPKNRAREIFQKKVVPQLGYNEDAFRKTLIRDAVPMTDGAVRYKVDSGRLDRFFSALSFGIVYKACNESLPVDYVTRHVYHNFLDDEESAEERLFRQMIFASYQQQQPLDILDFGEINAQNTAIYSAKIFGVQGFRSSITVTHEFFGTFHVTSMLTKRPPSYSGE